MKSYARANIRNGLPPTNPQISDFELSTFLFKHMIVDSCDGHSINEQDNRDGYNMLLLHPITHMIHWCYSCDFDFVELERI